jgi:hypothetical protein
LIRLSSQNEERKVTARETLLIRDSLVNRQENVKAGGFRKRQQLTISLAREASLRDGLSFVTDQAPLKSARNAFVEQDFHCNWPTNEVLANSSAATAA